MPIYILSTHTTAFDNDANSVAVEVDDAFIAYIRKLVDVYRYGKVADHHLFAIEVFDASATFYPYLDTTDMPEVYSGIWQAPEGWMPVKGEEAEEDEDPNEPIKEYDGEAQTLLVSESDVWFRILPSGEGAEVNSDNIPLWLLGLLPRPDYVDRL